jgi:hypothetical protein
MCPIPLVVYSLRTHTNAPVTNFFFFLFIFLLYICDTVIVLGYNLPLFQWCERIMISRLLIRCSTSELPHHINTRVTKRLNFGEVLPLTILKHLQIFKTLPLSFFTRRCSVSCKPMYYCVYSLVVNYLYNY